MAYPAKVYRVSLTIRAERDLAHLYQQICAADSEAARKWYSGFKKRILSLENYPARCPIFRAKSSLRALHYGRKPNVYLAIYRVRAKQLSVDVLHIRHGARRSPKFGDLQ